MSQNKNARQLALFLERNGYAAVRRTSAGALLYRNTDVDGKLGVIAVVDGLSEKVALHHEHNVRKALGLPTAKDAKKRNPHAVAERQEAERQRAAAEIEQSRRELADLRDEKELRIMYAHEERAERDALLGGLGRNLTNNEVVDITRRIAEKEQELRQWQLLSSKPVGNRDRHRA